MDSFHLKEDECYQKQCGEMFFTNQGRLIFHCTLCDDRKFDGFDLYEIHIKEHIPISPDEEQIDRKPLQNDTISILENCLEQSIYTNEDHPLTFPFIKEENDSINAIDALNEVEVPVSEIKNQKRVSFKSLRRVTAAGNKVKGRRKSKKPQKESCGNDVTVKPKKAKENNIQIPTVVHEVRIYESSRSLLIPPKERNHSCPICNAAFKCKSNMVSHIKRHARKKDHKCPECDKEFYSKNEVRIHMRSHNKERPYLCSICGRSYVTNSQLRGHLQRHANERNHKCEICQKTFFNKTHLRNHTATHSNDRPFSCDICPSVFKRKKALTNHLKLHENKQSYKCKLCDSAYNQRAGLFMHMKSAHQIS